MFQRIKKGGLAALAAVGGLGASSVASAAGQTVLTNEMADALGQGFSNLQATVADVISVAWPFVLAVLALYAAPSIVKKLWGMATR